MVSQKEHEKKLRKKFGRISKRTHREGRMNVYIYSSSAKKNTPQKHVDLDSPYWRGKKKGGKKRVHVGTYVPSAKRGFMFPSMKKHVK